MPALVRAEPADLEREARGARRGSDGPHGRTVEGCEGRLGDSVGDDHRVDVERPHQVLHVSAHRRDRRDEVERTPVDAIEPEVVVRVPQQRGTVTQPLCVEPVAEDATEPGGLPLLEQHGDDAPARRRRPHDVVDEPRRQGAQQLAHLLDLAPTGRGELQRPSPPSGVWDLPRTRGSSHSPGPRTPCRAPGRAPRDHLPGSTGRVPRRRRPPLRACGA